MSSGTAVERAFDDQWLKCKPEEFPDPVEQCRCDVDFEMRFDRAWVDKLIAVEISGGAFTNGGHNRGMGMMRDYQRHNFATALGWRIFYAIPKMYDEDPVGFFAPIISLLGQSVLSPDAELRMWTARICNLKHVGDTVSNNGIMVERRRSNTFVLEFSSGRYTVDGRKLTVKEAQRDTINLILRGASDAATPSSLRLMPRKAPVQAALF